MKAAAFTIAALILFEAEAVSNPTPPPAEGRFTVMHTLEFTLNIEYPMKPDTLSTFILYGGPTLVYVWSPDESRGFGVGIELGGELRKYFQRPVSGLFAGGYIGAGALWKSDDETVETVSAGVKLGNRIPFLSGDEVLMDIEPYLCLGFQLLDLNGDNESRFSDTTLYLGFKLDFY
jgi:hypothetical protein